MKKLFLLLLIGLGLMVVSCEKDKISPENPLPQKELHQKGDLAEKDIGSSPTSVNIPAMSEDSIRLAMRNASSRNSWVPITSYSLTSSGGWYNLNGTISRAILEQYDIQFTISSTNYTGAIITHGYPPFRWIRGYYVHPNTSTSMTLTLDDLQSQETQGYFHTYSWYSGTNYQVSIYARRTIPVGWSLVESGNGVRLFKKGGTSHYVQEVNLTKASIAFHQGSSVLATSNNPSPSFVKRRVSGSSNSYWSQYGSQAFSIVNAAFFYGSESAFPIKYNNTLVSAGYGNNEPWAKRTFEVYGSYADVKPYTNTSNDYSTVLSQFSHVPTAMVGIHPAAKKPRDEESIERTFIGLTSANSDKVYILTTRSRTQLEAFDLLKNEFNCNGSKIVMLDGGGSTQMTCENVNYITSSRAVPSIIAIYE